MIEIKYIVAVLTFVIGIVYMRKELKELFSAMSEREYVELNRLRRKNNAGSLPGQDSG